MDTLVETCKTSATREMEHFLMLFSHVPDDKLTWTPTPTTKSALRIAAHVGVTAGNFAQMIKDRRLPFGDEIPAFVEKNLAAELAITSRDQAVSVFRANTQLTHEALDTLSPDEADLVLDSGQGWTAPMSWLMRLPGWHATLHAGQLDFLQTCWDDQEIHFA